MRFAKFAHTLDEFLQRLTVHMDHGWTSWWQSQDQVPGIPQLSDRTIRDWLDGNCQLTRVKWDAFKKRITPTIKENGDLQERLEALDNLAAQIWKAEHDQQRTAALTPSSIPSDVPEAFRQVFGADTNIFLIYSELTLHMTVPKIIDAYSELLPYAPTGVVPVADPQLRSILKERPLVTYDPGGRHGKDGYNFQAMHSACVCEVRAAAYMAAALSQFKSLQFHVVGNAHDEVHRKADLSFVSFGTLINSKTQTLLKDSQAFVDFRYGRFVSKRLDSNERSDHDLKFLHEAVDDSSEYDYGVIVRIHPSDSTIRDERVWIACAGVQQVGTSGAAFVLANWREIASELKYHTSRFVALVKVPRHPDKGDEFAKLQWIAERPEDLKEHEL